jgi:hypothetical protein
MYEFASYYSLSQQNVAEDLLKFRSGFIGHCFATQLKITVKQWFNDLIDVIMMVFPGTEHKPKCYDSRTATIANAGLMIVIEDHHDHHNDLWKVYDRSVTLHCNGGRDLISGFIQDIKAAVPHNLVPSVTWEFMSGDDRESQDIQIQPAKPIYPEYCPWIGDVYAYFDRYLASESSILVLLGETGTMKTSFIRSLIWYAQMNTMFTYEENLLGSDSLFVDFIVDDRTDLLVIEDADLLLTDREHDGNKVMSKFLNVSDGLANIGRKKIIFTANITDSGKIDPAMLRPGRCFDCQVFRRLNYAEACAAASVAGLPQPKIAQTYTLAELFAQDHRSYATKTLGFKAH